MAEVYPECCADAAPPPRPAARALHRAQGAQAEAGSARSAARERRAREAVGCGPAAGRRRCGWRCPAARVRAPRRRARRRASAACCCSGTPRASRWRVAGATSTDLSRPMVRPRLTKQSLAHSREGRWAPRARPRGGVGSAHTEGCAGPHRLWDPGGLLVCSISGCCGARWAQPHSRPTPHALVCVLHFALCCTAAV